MKPNILLITADDMNYNSTGFMGCEVPGITPNLDQLAADGICFKHAHVTVAVCKPSREVLMTGRYAHRNGAPGFYPIDEDCPTLQEQLKEAGYMNGIVGKVNHLAPKHKYCWDYYCDTFNKENDFGRAPEKYYQYTKEFIEQAQKEDRPFYLMANSHDPHRPFAGAARERSKFGGHIPYDREYDSKEVEVPDFLPDIPDVRKEVAQYYTSVHRCDQTVGKILQALDDCGERDNTLVMFLSDNGMDFPFGKSNCYLNSTKTPWVVRWPGKIKAGQIDEKHMISGIDYMPTILDAVNLPQVPGMDGRSFLSLLQGKSQDRESVFTAYYSTAAKREYPMRCFQTKKYGYIYNAWSNQEKKFVSSAVNDLTYDAMVEAAKNDEEIAKRVDMFDYRVREEFYDFNNDPDGLNNLIDDSEYQNKINEIKTKLLAKMRGSDDPLAETFANEMGIE